jgi:cytidylate kinase
MAIITLSRELGSLGTEIAETLSSTLGYPRLDKESLEAMLTNLGMAEAQVGADDERRPGLWEQFTNEKVRYLDYMKAAMYRFAGGQDCIIVGRGANIIFRGIPGTLRLRITAPAKVRVARLRERLGIDEQHALRMVHQSDHDRAGYHKYFFNAAWDAAADYDLVVNTAAISPAETCDAVSALLSTPTYAGARTRARAVLEDLRIAQDVILALAYRERINITSLDVSCTQGVVAVHGIVRHSSVLDQCLQIANAVEGVAKVISYVEVIEFAYYAGM